ncbi:DUF3653 domain-containing protein [Ferrimonas balearica]|uniref:DUF3653 domain-containing protein n=1 Tax=Ferrimonas balearica TaxID=44012 RepID=UPI001F1A4945|nr:DUF3653 domain-containing protein [Ferrimonas balearica]MBY6095118.1 phage protein [Ferrimonas balearica]
MTTTTRFWLELSRTFPRADCRGVDLEAAAEALGVAPTSVKRWRTTEPPRSIVRCLELHRRAIPATKDWDGFRFFQGKLYTPFSNLNFTPSELLHVFYEREFQHQDKVARQRLQEQLGAVRNEDERREIVGELESVIAMLNAIKCSPLVSVGLGCQKSVRRQVKDNANR